MAVGRVEEGGGREDVPQEKVCFRRRCASGVRQRSRNGVGEVLEG